MDFETCKHNTFIFFSAFSIFSVFEYMIAYANMGYHVTGYLEFCKKTLIAADLHPETVKNGNRYPIRNGRTKAD